MKPTQEQVMALAREAGASVYTNRSDLSRPFHTFSPEQLSSFHTLVRNQALEDAANLEWTDIMRDGSLVTWSDAETLGGRAVEQLRNMKDKT